jgi:hypothetical protein
MALLINPFPSIFDFHDFEDSGAARMPESLTKHDGELAARRRQRDD